MERIIYKTPRVPVRVKRGGAYRYRRSWGEGTRCILAFLQSRRSVRYPTGRGLVRLTMGMSSVMEDHLWRVNDNAWYNNLPVNEHHFEYLNYRT